MELYNILSCWFPDCFGHSTDDRGVLSGDGMLSSGWGRGAPMGAVCEWCSLLPQSSHHNWLIITCETEPWKVPLVLNDWCGGGGWGVSWCCWPAGAYAGALIGTVPWQVLCMIDALAALACFMVEWPWHSCGLAVLCMNAWCSAMACLCVRVGLASVLGHTSYWRPYCVLLNALLMPMGWTDGWPGVWWLGRGVGCLSCCLTRQGCSPWLWPLTSSSGGPVSMVVACLQFGN